MRVREILSGLCAALFCATTALAGVLPTTPTGTITVDGTPYPVAFARDEESGLWAINFSVDVPNQYRVTLVGTIDPDPYINYGLSVTDFGAPSSFGFSISSPIVSTSAPTEVIASIAGGLNDVTGNGISLAPTLADSDGDSIAELQVASAGLPLQNMGVDVGSGVSYGAGQAGALYVYGPYTEPIQPGPNAGPYTTLKLDVGFTLSGGGDIVSLTGHAEIAEDGGIVPEPGTLTLGACGLALIGFFGRRRIRRTANRES
jgi:hypothetical protein